MPHYLKNRTREVFGRVSKKVVWDEQLIIAVKAVRNALLEARLISHASDKWLDDASKRHAFVSEVRTSLGVASSRFTETDITQAARAVRKNPDTTGGPRKRETVAAAAPKADPLARAKSLSYGC